MNDVITVIRDPYKALGKRFWLEGEDLHKKSVVSVGFAIAVMHEVPDVESLEKLLREVGSDSHAAVINAKFKGIDTNEEFVILSEQKFKNLLGLEGRENILGVHQLSWQGRSYKAVARFKENVEPSSWQLLDRDVDDFTPACFAKMEFEEWLSCVQQILPVTYCDYLHVASSSSRVVAYE